MMNQKVLSLTITELVGPFCIVLSKLLSIKRDHAEHW